MRWIPCLRNTYENDPIRRSSKLIRRATQAYRKLTKLRTAERIVNLIAVFCMLSWRIFWMTMMNRVAPGSSPLVARTHMETHLLDTLIPDDRAKRRRDATLSRYLTKIAQLGGYLARTKDSPPGNTVMWRGFSRLTAIQLGFVMGAQLVDNQKLHRTLTPQGGEDARTRPLCVNTRGA
jgi:hypothetical protein